MSAPAAAAPISRDRNNVCGRPARLGRASLGRGPSRFIGARGSVRRAAEEVSAGDDTLDVACVNVGDDEHAVVEERLGELGVREVGADVDVLGVHVVADRLVAAARSFLDRIVERARHEAGVLELLEVAGEESAHEFALAEDADELVLGVHHRERGEADVEDLLDRGADGFVAAQQGRLADEVAAEPVGCHGALLTGSGSRCRRWPGRATAPSPALRP
jgi:hypothetical protein